MSWRPLGAVEPRALSDARKRMHRNVQWLARVARSYAPAPPDDDDVALAWIDAPVSSLAEDEPEASPHIALTTNVPVRLVIVAPSLTVRYAPRLHQLWFGNPQRPNNVFNLDWPDAETAADLPRALASLGADAEPFRADNLPYAAELPVVPDRGPPESSAAAELCRYYSNAAEVIAALPKSGSDVRFWPRRFHLGRVFDLGGGRSIVVGLAPDDASCDRPHVYVAPSPCREPRTLPSPPPGMRWRREGATALIAAAEDFMLGAGAEQRVSTALRLGFGVCEELLAD